ncbi:MAG: response regulator [Ktedonobacteraceae bacterium]
MMTTTRLILIIDDSETVRKILEVCLHRAGYEEVRSFSDGAEMLRWLMTPAAKVPSLIFVDLNLPEIDSYRLIHHLKTKAAFAQTIFVILTGRNNMLDKLKGRLIGVQVYLTKPFRTQDITTVVAAHLDIARKDYREEQEQAGRGVLCGISMM